MQAYVTARYYSHRLLHVSLWPLKFSKRTLCSSVIKGQEPVVKQLLYGKKIANFDLFQFFTWEEPIEEHFHTDRRKQEEIISKELSEGKL